MKRQIHTVLLFALLVPACLPAAPGTTAPDKMREQYIQRMQQASQLVRDALELMKNEQYEEAINKLNAAENAAPGSALVSYNLACALARSGKPDRALAALERAVTAGFTDHAHMQTDPDLASLRGLDKFKKLVKTAEEMSKPKPPLMSVPNGYDKSGDREYPLFVALHGAGSSAEKVMPWIKSSLPATGYFILVPFGSVRAGPGYTWTSNDGKAIADKITELRKSHRIGRVILFGFSAGGHVGYSFVLQHRDLVDGFIPMAGAFRADTVPDELLKNAMGLPVYAIQGVKDNVVPPAAAKRSLAEFDRHGAITKLYEHDGAHAPPRNMAEALKTALAWINSQLDGQ